MLIDLRLLPLPWAGERCISPTLVSYSLFNTPTADSHLWNTCHQCSLILVNCYSLYCINITVFTATLLPRQSWLSICPSIRRVTLRNRDHIGRNTSTSRIIPWLISLGCSLSADHNIMDLLQRDHREIPCGIFIGQITRGIVLLLIYSFTFTSAFMQWM